ncbi:hypothetical protein SAMN05216331_10290 [Porphyromonadaceae bacterium KH3R12]|nr:hypothetical protein SAMN05216331_10290 [Porphyromonadaceae bacterium KH3R12]
MILGHKVRKIPEIMQLIFQILFHFIRIVKLFTVFLLTTSPHNYTPDRLVEAGYPLRGARDHRVYLI